MLYHNIEKGLSLPSPRPRFGEAAVGRLVQYTNLYIDRFGSDDVTEFATAALRGYVEFNERAGVARNDIPAITEIDRLDSAGALAARGGVKIVRRQEVMDASHGVELDFFLSRSSVREFSSTPVTSDEIEFAVIAAQKSPAVCNRQFGKVHVTTDRATINDALAVQAGARGFGDSVPALAVITTSARTYWNPEERMQPWTDGGMFAMSFVLGVHAQGMGSVCLNWSKLPAVDRTFRRRFSIADDELIVMLVAFGHLLEEYRVAVSPRVPVAQTLKKLERR